MTLPELFVLASKTTESLADVVERLKRIESQNQTIIIMLRQVQEQTPRKLKELVKENRILHKLLEKEL